MAADRPTVVRVLLSLVAAVSLLSACGSNAEEPIDAGSSTTTTTDASDSSTSSAPTTSTSTPDGIDTPASRDPDQRYRVTTTVLESAGHGPQLCLGGVAESYPPQCGGPDLVGWSWDDVDGEESASGTTWGTFSIVGTWDGAAQALTLTETPGPPDAAPSGDEHDYSPACTDPDGDPAADESTFLQPEDPDVAAVWVSSPPPPFVYSVIVRPGSADRIRALVREHWAGLLCVVERDQPSRDALAALQARIHDEAEDSPLDGVWTSFVDELEGAVVVGCTIADEVSVAWALEQWGPLVRLDGMLEPVD